eukprot:5846039-Pyramimonas_sp.AAC.1
MSPWHVNGMIIVIVVGWQWLPRLMLRPLRNPLLVYSHYSDYRVTSRWPSRSCNEASEASAAGRRGCLPLDSPPTDVLSVLSHV